jgi:hypothetical protein
MGFPVLGMKIKKIEKSCVESECVFFTCEKISTKIRSSLKLKKVYSKRSEIIN